MNNDEYIEMGTCTKPHGIKGDFIFNLLNPVDSALKNNISFKAIPLNSSSSIKPDGEPFEIKSIRFGNKVIVKLKDIEDRNIVESMIPFSIWIKREDFGEIDEDEVYLSDLIGLKVLSPEGDEIGQIKTFYDNGAQPVLVVELNDGNIVELPFVDVFFPTVNLDEEIIVMNNPGLF